MAPYENDTHPDTVTLQLIKKVLSLSDSQQETLLRQLEEPSFFEKNYGERNEARKTYIHTVFFELKGQRYEGISQDISEGGMYIKAGGIPVAVGKTVLLHIPYAKNDQHIRVPAEIVRIDTNGFGVEFLREKG